MQRLIEIKERLGVIERYLDIQAPFTNEILISQL
ncbi:Uncharacterised protein [Klebsiella aerogenes]|nr:Uncharacterised protein [Klebsiella aerogenes]